MTISETALNPGIARKVREAEVLNVREGVGSLRLLLSIPCHNQPLFLFVILRFAKVDVTGNNCLNLDRVSPILVLDSNGSLHGYARQAIHRLPRAKN